MVRVGTVLAVFPVSISDVKFYPILMRILSNSLEIRSTMDPI